MPVFDPRVSRARCTSAMSACATVTPGNFYPAGVSKSRPSVKRCANIDNESRSKNFRAERASATSERTHALEIFLLDARGLYLRRNIPPRSFLPVERRIAVSAANERTNERTSSGEQKFTVSKHGSPYHIVSISISPER